jgi:hypothetical protein
MTKLKSKQEIRRTLKAYEREELEFITTHKMSKLTLIQERTYWHINGAILALKYVLGDRP